MVTPSFLYVSQLCFSMTPTVLKSAVTKGIINKIKKYSFDSFYLWNNCVISDIANDKSSFCVKFIAMALLSEEKKGLF